MSIRTSFEYPYESATGNIGGDLINGELGCLVSVHYAWSWLISKLKIGYWNRSLTCVLRSINGLDHWYLFRYYWFKWAILLWISYVEVIYIKLILILKFVLFWIRAKLVRFYKCIQWLLDLLRINSLFIGLWLLLHSSFIFFRFLD